MQSISNQSENFRSSSSLRSTDQYILFDNSNTNSHFLSQKNQNQQQTALQSAAQLIQKPITDETNSEKSKNNLKSKIKQMPSQPNTREVFDLIQQSIPIEKKNIKFDSLQYDIKLGWIPKTQITGPIPISFNHNFLDSIVNQKLQEGKIVYLGYRPTNTFELHQKYYWEGKKYPFYQFHLCKSQFLERFFKKYYSNFEFNLKRKVGMLSIQQSQTASKQSHLAFDSDFEGGNLDAVYFQNNQYRLIIRCDSNTKGHCNYYNFKIKCFKSGTYTFRIMNMSKKKSLYERGMKPYIKIYTKNSKQQTEWSQREDSQCHSVKFGPSPFNQLQQSYGKFQCLKFQLELKKQAQWQLCYNIPYCYSELLEMINSIRQTKDIHVSKLGYSLSGVQIPLLTVSENLDNAKREENKDEKSNYFVIITGRIHPAESNSSHIINGLIKFLLKGAPEFKKFFKNVVFKIVPMLNPDGVICGNTRTGFAGKDLNRKFSSKSEFIFPEVNNLRDYVTKLKEKQGKKLLFVIDIHGHSTRKGSFFFGPQYPVLDEEYSRCRLLPKLYSSRSEAFRYYSCKFKISQDKTATSRGYFNGHDIRTYTHETSIHCYYDFKERKDLSFTRKSLQNLGKDLGLAIFDYLDKIKKLVVKQKTISKNVEVKESSKQIQELLEQIKTVDEQRDSDKMPSEKADSESDGDDVDDKQLNVFYQKINQNREYFYEEILKNLKNKNDFSILPPKQKKLAFKEPENNREKQKSSEKPIKSYQKASWQTKPIYTPKKTLFEEYQKPQNAVIGKSNSQKSTNNFILKLKAGNNPNLNMKRVQFNENENILLNFQKIKLQSHSNRMIYSVPNIKWDYNTQKSGAQSVQNNEIYRYDLTNPSQVENSNKKNILKHSKNLPSTESLQKQDQKIKLNKQLLQKLLTPSVNSLINQQKANQSKLETLREQKLKFTSIINQKKSNSITKEKSLNQRIKHYNYSQIKNKQMTFEQNQKNQLLGLPNGPLIQTEKQEYLCKKWEKQIVFKTKKCSSFNNKPAQSQKKLIPSLRTHKNFLYSKNKTQSKGQELNSMLLFRKVQHLPKIHLKKDTITTQNPD